jgi:hypothetical protein
MKIRAVKKAQSLHGGCIFFNPIALPTYPDKLAGLGPIA